MLPLTIHGKPDQVVRLLTDNDLPQLKEFCDQCGLLGLENNKNFTAIKLSEMTMPYGQFFIATNDDKIFSLAGIHKLPEVGPSAYRCLFRGAQLPGYTPQWSMDIFKSGIHFSYFLYAQIKFIQDIDPLAEFYISTNVDNPSAGSSSKLDKFMMPRLAKKGYCSLYQSNVTLYSTQQNIWKINVDNYLHARNQTFA
jgi:hypothetical protein